MNVQIRNKTRHHELDEYFPLCEEYLRKTLQLLQKKEDYVISLTLVGPVSIHRLNRDYRGIDRVTDVISFAINDLDEGFAIPEEEIDLGDIFINVNRVHTQARDYGHSVKREFLFLFVHGLLHCLGYDHQTPEQEEEMFSLQKQILGDLR
ncbi:MAG: rRNA maturation RNase YbeY [Erysipelotrichaceae bacterium]|nr:rRNA maturation RNase YbeY [Erysipelotrichaceae bacterium]